MAENLSEPLLRKLLDSLYDSASTHDEGTILRLITSQPWRATELSEAEGEPWPVPSDSVMDEHLPYRVTTKTVNVHGAPVPAATLRRIGWLDQRGRVWLKVPDTTTAGRERCGSFIPLLIDVRGDD
jgi:hypothetical protein